MENWEELVRESMRDYQPQVPDNCWESLSQQLDALHAAQGGASAAEQGGASTAGQGAEVTSEAVSGTASEAVSGGTTAAGEATASGAASDLTLGAASEAASATVNAASEMSGASGMVVNGGKIAGSFMGKAAAFFSGAAAKAALGVAVAGGLAFMGYRLLSGSDKEVEPAAQVVAATEKTMEQNDAEQFANQESAPTEEENFSNTSFSEGIPSFLTEDPVAANEDKSVNQMAEAGMGTSVVPEREASQQNRAISQQQPVAERADAASNRTVTAEKNVSDRAVVAEKNASAAHTTAAAEKKASAAHTTAVTESKNEKKSSVPAVSADTKFSTTAKTTGETKKTEGMDMPASPQPAISIPNVITPNGDNVNDYLEITGLEQLTETRLVIYNRGGKVVYEKRAYDNSWQAENLPDGVYYYWFSFEYEGKSLMRQGSIHVIR